MTPDYVMNELTYFDLRNMMQLVPGDKLKIITDGQKIDRPDAEMRAAFGTLGRVIKK